MSCRPVRGFRETYQANALRNGSTNGTATTLVSLQLDNLCTTSYHRLSPKVRHPSLPTANHIPICLAPHHRLTPCQRISKSPASNGNFISCATCALMQEKGKRDMNVVIPEDEPKKKKPVMRLEVVLPRKKPVDKHVESRSASPAPVPAPAPQNEPSNAREPEVTHPFANVSDATYAPPVNHNFAAAPKPQPPKKADLAYKIGADLRRQSSYRRLQSCYGCASPIDPA